MKVKKNIHQKLTYGSLIFSCIALSTVVYKQHNHLNELKHSQVQATTNAPQLLDTSLVGSSQYIENLSDKEELKKKIELIREISVNKAQKSIKVAREIPRVKEGHTYPNGSHSLEQFKATVFEVKEFSIDKQLTLDEDLYLNVSQTVYVQYPLEELEKMRKDNSLIDEYLNNPANELFAKENGNKKLKF
ncbi:hypothetical protein [Lactococcus garvieae]|uniref:hypothetical protein n=1 Tax=Lactococcus garvieae TaxID=1363 RepID=UPI0038534E1C